MRTDISELNPFSAAEISGYSVQQIRRFLRTGELKGAKNEKGAWKISQKDFLKWLEGKNWSDYDDTRYTSHTLPEAAVKLGIGSADLRYHVLKGHVKAFFYHGQWFIKKEEIDNFRKKRENGEYFHNWVK